MFVHLFPVCKHAAQPIRHIRCDLTSRADCRVTLARAALIKTSDLRRASLTPAFVAFLSLPLFLSVYFKPCSLSPSSFLFAFLELCPFALSSMSYSV